MLIVRIPSSFLLCNIATDIICVRYCVACAYRPVVNYKQLVPSAGDASFWLQIAVVWELAPQGPPCLLVAPQGCCLLQSLWLTTTACKQAVLEWMMIDSQHGMCACVCVHTCVRAFVCVSVLYA